MAKHGDLQPELRNVQTEYAGAVPVRGAGPKLSGCGGAEVVEAVRAEVAETEAYLAERQDTYREVSRPGLSSSE